MREVSTDQVVHRELAVDGREPAMQIAAHVSAITGRGVDSLDSTWETIGDVIDPLFDDTPSADAHVQVTFTDENFRITVEQNRHAKFVPLQENSE